MTGDVHHQRKIAAELIAWHLAAGVDTPLDDLPHDRFREATNEAAVPREAPKRVGEGAPGGGSKVRPREQAAAIPMVTPAPADDWVREARARAEAAPSLEALRETIEHFEGCSLSRTAKSLIMARGAIKDGIMVIGDAPEADDDRSGEAFSGRPGVLLDAMLKAIGLERSSLVLTTAIPWRPPGNRAATGQELDVCTPFLVRQVELVKPKLILALGAMPAQLLAGRSESILKLRGQWLSVASKEMTVPMLATLPPVYLLRQPMQKRFAWRDLKAFRAAFGDPLLP